MNTFRTFVIPGALGAKAKAIADALGYPDKGTFVEVREGTPPAQDVADTRPIVAYAASGIVDSTSALLKDAASLFAALNGSAGITLADCENYVKALDLTQDSPLPRIDAIKTEIKTPAPAASAWAQPQGTVGMYAKGAVVTDGGATWVSLIDANVWRPGVSGWRQHMGAAGGPAPWVQPTGAHDAYKLGALVTYQGATWKNTGSDANVWAPGVFGWTKQ